MPPSWRVGPPSGPAGCRWPALPPRLRQSPHARAPGCLQQAGGAQVSANINRWRCLHQMQPCTRQQVAVCACAAHAKRFAESAFFALLLFPDWEAAHEAVQALPTSLGQKQKALFCSRPRKAALPCPTASGRPSALFLPTWAPWPQPKALTVLVSTGQQQGVSGGVECQVRYAALGHLHWPPGHQCLWAVQVAQQGACRKPTRGCANGAANPYRTRRTPGLCQAFLRD